MKTGRTFSSSISVYTDGWTPILNTADNPFYDLKKGRDHRNFLKQLEMIAPPGSHMTLQGKQYDPMVTVKIDTYSSHAIHYVDRRFLVPYPLEGDQVVISEKMIIDRLMDCKKKKVRYFWGGNCIEGIPRMRHFYPLPASEDEDDFYCRGVDCSGLLYYATHGKAPRNTADLLSYGEKIAGENSLTEESKKRGRPLDIFIKKGHVAILLYPDEVIESREKQGVITSPLEEWCEKNKEEGYSLRRILTSVYTQMN